MQIKIYENTSSEGIRQALGRFGRFSTIEIDQEKNDANNGTCLIFREVGILESLHRLIFESKEELEKKRKKQSVFFI